MWQYQKLDVRPVSGALGAEIAGVDLSKPLDNETFSDIHKAFLDHSVLFFRDQHLTPEQHIGFARRFGPVHEHPFTKGMAEHPEIIEILKVEEDVTNWGDGWHTDVPFEEEPPLGSVLYAKEVPPYSGDTFFSSLHLAYETLSDGMKKTIDPLIGVHIADDRLFQPFTQMNNKKDNPVLRVEHPLVRTHVQTGRRSLYTNRNWLKHFKGWTPEESRPIIDYLNQHAEKPEFTCRFRWEANSIAFWDNRCTLHLANHDYFYKQRGMTPARRRMHRVAIRGERPR